MRRYSYAKFETFFLGHPVFCIALYYYHFMCYQFLLCNKLYEKLKIICKYLSTIYIFLYLYNLYINMYTNRDDSAYVIGIQQAYDDKQPVGGLT